MKYFLYILLCFPLSVFCQSDTVTYSLVSAGVIKGFDKTWKNADGSYENWYQFNDRGRGDSLRTTYRETEDGFPIYVHAHGVDYMKNPVFEEFSLENNIATWRNPVEEESRLLQGEYFFNGLKSESGHRLKAMHTHNNKIRMLPYGDQEMKVLQHYVVQHGPKPVEVDLVEIKGSGYTPNYTWMDADFMTFGSVNDWISSILKGYEEAIPELLTIQNKYELEYFSNLASTIPHPLEKWMLIRNVNVFDSKAATIIHGQDVLIEKGKIAAVIPTGIIVPTEGMTIDGTGQTLIPGLWDMHTHTVDNMDGMLFLACGVTHIRDMGNSKELLVKRQQFMDGELIGPRIEVVSGLIDAQGPMAAPTGALINNLEEGLQAVRDYAKAGYHQIKLYSSVHPEWVKPMAIEAHALGLRVCGHIPAFMTATEAIHDGYDEITHMNMLALNFFGDTIDTRIPLRFSIPAQRTAGLDLKGKEFQEFIRLLKSKNIAVDPTINVFEELFLAKDKVVSPVYAWAVDHFPLNAQRNMKAGGGGIPVPPGMESTYQKSFDAFGNLLMELYHNDIRILPGTDAFPGFSLFRELELYVQAGIPAEKALQMATWNMAVYTGHDQDYGSIELGKAADFILVQGDPVESITNLHHIKMVVSNNRMYEPNKLFEGISIKAF